MGGSPLWTLSWRYSRLAVSWVGGLVALVEASVDSCSTGPSWLVVAPQMPPSGYIGLPWSSSSSSSSSCSTLVHPSEDLLFLVFLQILLDGFFDDFSSSGRMRHSSPVQAVRPLRPCDCCDDALDWPCFFFGSSVIFHLPALLPLWHRSFFKYINT